MPTPSQPAGAPNDRENVNRARQAAEDLFRPRRQTASENISTAAQSAGQSAEPEARRPPRIFMIPSAGPTRAAKAETPAKPKPVRRPEVVRPEVVRPEVVRDERREIPASQFGRVRALTRYGMTRSQVAKLYGVAVEEIERIVRRPDRSRGS